MMAELLGREDGYCRGKGGSMHIADFGRNMLGANGIVGGGFGIAAGAALSAQLRADGAVALCFFGDGAINQGAFHGVANIAAIWKLPLILLCENNRFAMSGRVERMTAVADLSRRAAAYDIPGQTIDGVDPIAVRDAVSAAAERARAGEDPTLLIVPTATASPATSPATRCATGRRRRTSRGSPATRSGSTSRRFSTRAS